MGAVAVGTVPGGHVVRPIPDGTCDALGIVRGDGTTVRFGPWPPPPSATPAAHRPAGPRP